MPTSTLQIKSSNSVLTVCRDTGGRVGGAGAGAGCGYVGVAMCARWAQGQGFKVKLALLKLAVTRGGRSH